MTHPPPDHSYSWHVLCPSCSSIGLQGHCGCRLLPPLGVRLPDRLWSVALGVVVALPGLWGLAVWLGWRAW